MIFLEIQIIQLIILIAVFLAGIFAGLLMHVIIRQIRKLTGNKIDIYNKENQLDIFMTKMPDFMYIKDTESRFIVANKLNSDVFHLESSADLIGKSDSDFYPKEYAEKFLKDEKELFRTGQPLIGEVEKGLDDKGNIIFISTSKYPIFNKKQKIIGLVGVGRDVTKLKDYETKLERSYKELKKVYLQLKNNQERIYEQSEQLKTQAEELEFANKQLTELIKTRDKFFSIIAHDLKNPVNLLHGFSELLVYRYNDLDDERRKKYSETIYKTTSNLNELLDKLLQWSRMQTGGITFEPQVINVNAYINENLVLLNQMIENKAIELIIQVHPDDFFIYGDINMLDFVLRNLTINAIKYSHRGGKIILGAQLKGKMVEFCITDFGIGMEAKSVKGLFEITRNQSKNGTEGETGSGLGLLLCKDFVERNHGKIWCESSEGSGSKFYFTVPAS